MTPSELTELEEIQKRHDTSAPIHCEKAARTREENARAILSYNKCREDRATLLSLIESLRAREGWLPIESAPRDGTNIIAWWSKSKTYSIVYWDADESRWEDYSDNCEISAPSNWRPLASPPSGGRTDDVALRCARPRILQMTEKVLVQMRFGSHLYGTATPASDVDIKAVHIPRGRDLLLLRADKVISRKTKADNTAKNTAEDTDYESYSVQKYLALAAEGQTVALDMLFAPEWAWRSVDPLWQEIRANKDKLLTSRYSSFIGYCRTQANKYGIKGSRMAAARAIVEFLEQTCDLRNGYPKVADIEAPLTAFVVGKDHMAIVEIAQHGVDSDKPPMKHIEVCNRKMPFHSSIKRTYDTYKNLFNEYGARARQAEINEGVDWKALSHAVRIGRQAIEVLQTGNVVFPRVDAQHLLAVKTGKLEYKAVAAEIEELLARIEVEAERSPLPEAPDYAWIDDFVCRVHKEAVWNA